MVRDAGPSAAALVPGVGLWHPVAAPPYSPGLHGTAASPITTLPDGTVLLRELRYAPATDTWQTLAPPETVGQGATQTLLPDGRVLLVGGRQYGPATATATLYTPATNDWTPAASLPSARTAHTATLLADGTVLVIGGAIQPTTALRYTPATDIWTPTAPLAIGRVGHTATRLADGRVLVTGGQDADGVARAAHTATLLADSTVLVVGGVAPSGAVYSIERYDPGTGNWRSVA